MNYYTKEIWNEEGYQRTAGIKARDDVDAILEKNGFKALEICVPQEDRVGQNLLQKMQYHRKLSRIWDECLSCAGSGDVIVIQFPIINHSVLLSGCIGKVRKRGARITQDLIPPLSFFFASLFSFFLISFLIMSRKYPETLSSDSIKSITSSQMNK